MTAKTSVDSTADSTAGQAAEPTPKESQDTAASPKPTPNPAPKTDPSPAPKPDPVDRDPVRVSARVTEKQRQAQFVEAYLRHRFSDRLDHFERGRKKLLERSHVDGRARGDVVHRRGRARGGRDGGRAAQGDVGVSRPQPLRHLRTAISAYEATFGFRRLARENATTSVALQRLAVDGPTPDDVDDERLVAFVTEVESVLRYGR